MSTEGKTERTVLPAGGVTGARLVPTSVTTDPPFMLPDDGSTLLTTGAGHGSTAGTCSGDGPSMHCVEIDAGEGASQQEELETALSQLRVA